MGVAPTVSRKCRAKTERDMPTRSASDCSVQGYPGSLCMLVMAMLMCLSDSAESQPRPALAASAGAGAGLDERRVGELLRNQRTAGLWVAELPRA